MELSRTINSDKRYYLDKKTIENAASLLETMRVFNDAKMYLYNALYDQKYLNAGPLLDHAYPVFLKEKYKTNDYYNAAIYTAASGQISSQKELKKYYKTTIAADLKTRDEKIQSVKEQLDKNSYPTTVVYLNPRTVRNRIYSYWRYLFPDLCWKYFLGECQVFGVCTNRDSARKCTGGEIFLRIFLQLWSCAGFLVVCSAEAGKRQLEAEQKSRNIQES